jgi:hypothetical protein
MNEKRDLPPQWQYIHKLSVFENRVLRKIYGSKKQDMRIEKTA